MLVEEQANSMSNQDVAMLDLLERFAEARQSEARDMQTAAEADQHLIETLAQKEEGAQEQAAAAADARALADIENRQRVQAAELRAKDLEDELEHRRLQFEARELDLRLQLETFRTGFLSPSKKGKEEQGGFDSNVCEELIGSMQNMLKMLNVPPRSTIDAVSAPSNMAGSNSKSSNSDRLDRFAHKSGEVQFEEGATNFEKVYQLWEFIAGGILEREKDAEGLLQSEKHARNYAAKLRQEIVRLQQTLQTVSRSSNMNNHIDSSSSVSLPPVACETSIQPPGV